MVESNNAAVDQKGIIHDCDRIRKVLLNLSETYQGPLNKESLSTTALPFVLVLGNHSSGKSSFINYILGQDIQTTGVAPTDDYFTIIVHGEEDYDRVGQAVMEDPDLGFQGLSKFGPMLSHKTKLKIRSKIAVKDFMIVDSPGMIDSPALSPEDKFNAKKGSMDRGYDFEEVCRWFAERADIILLFFDPDKPGTTGETLSVLTNSLSGLEDKINIILNKADRFHKIHDFARAYGSLCWNLSKVIPRKDLPQIHTVSLYSTRFLVGQSPDGSTIPNNDQSLSILRDSILDLDESRNAVLKEVFQAPIRRVDNEISRVSEASKMLLMHCKVYRELISVYNQYWWKSRVRWLITTASVTSLSTAAFALLQQFSASLFPPNSNLSLLFSQSNTHNHSNSHDVSIAYVGDAAAAAATSNTASLMASSWSDIWNSMTSLKSILISACMGTLFGFSYYKIQNYFLNKKASLLTTPEGQEKAFEHVYARELLQQDREVISTWGFIRSKMTNHLTLESVVSPSFPNGISQLESDMKVIERLTLQDLPDLRKRAAPNFPLLGGQWVHDNLKRGWNNLLFPSKNSA